MVKLIINGCHGRMGRVLIEMVQEMEGVSVAAGVDPCKQEGAADPFPVYPRLKDVKEEAHVVVDFSNPQGIPLLLEGVRERGLPVVIATTGLSDEAQGLVEQAARVIPVFQSANMSLGVNLLRELIKKAAAVLGDDFDIEIVEKHHRMKKDSPSGTALLLAQALNEEKPQGYQYIYGRSETDKARQPRELGLHAVRGGTFVGEHEVIFAGPEEVVELTHKAYSRRIFATGAVKAALFMAGRKPGLYSMADLVGSQVLPG